MIKYWYVTPSNREECQMIDPNILIKFLTDDLKIIENVYYFKESVHIYHLLRPHL